MNNTDQMRCYYCDELIRINSSSCRWCGRSVSPANQFGLPTWYLNTGLCGLRLVWIEMDLIDRALDESGELFCLIGGDDVGIANDIFPDLDEDLRIGRVISSISKRLDELRSGDKWKMERSLLTMYLAYCNKIRNLVNGERDKKWSRENLDSIQNSLGRWLESDQFSDLPANLQSDFEVKFGNAISSIDRYKE